MLKAPPALFNLTLSEAIRSDMCQILPMCQEAIDQNYMFELFVGELPIDPCQDACRLQICSCIGKRGAVSGPTIRRCVDNGERKG